MDAENRLREFRRERERKETLGKVKKFISTPFDLLRKKMIVTVEAPAKLESTVNCDDESCESDSDVFSLVDEEVATADDNSLMGLRGHTKYLTYFALWAVPYILLIKVGFGAVYFCITALLLIYFNTRTRPKLKNEPSAYSVFNQGCAPIEGAVSSEQLEKQIRSGILEYPEYLDFIPNVTQRPRCDRESHQLDVLSETEFKDKHRLPKEGELQSPIPYLCGRRFWRETGDLVGVSESTVSSCVKQIAGAIARNLMPRFILRGTPRK